MPIAIDAEREVSLLARVLGKNEDELPPYIARYLLTLGFSESDKSRMHNLTMRNQDGALSDDEAEELHAYARIGTVVSILKSRARKVLKRKLKKT